MQSGSPGLTAASPERQTLNGLERQIELLLTGSTELAQVFREFTEQCRRESRSLSQVETAAISLAVAKANDCRPGIQVSADELRHAGAPESWILSLRLGESLPAIAGRKLNALVFYARKLTLLPNSVGKDDLKELCSAGYAEHEVPEIVQLVAYCNYLNRMASGLSIGTESVVSKK